ncbi:ATP-dependent helicase HrpB [Paenibacillus sp. L3-i20]|uniref:ATP-dependent helicase HrpB n=1 Tax=Paenibacillus sp. L3-i20 TaxID=2905833 RepID=UPI001EDEAA45|nr:ATP-dependent helicase HrpB [Paenibacillus sp. L3-i20]GKU78781.1 ATP-dependent helicase HrpB [Paenibacillus sp. L3-i20]
MKHLPIDEVLPQLLESLNSGLNAVLIAEPGAGKTTRVPLALLNQPWLSNKRIILLEPRRLAARSAALFMAQSLGEQVGETVGYRVRMDRKVGPGTIIEVVTEGILTRMLQSDPALEDVGVIIFDEFHERNLHSDLGLALCLQSQGLLREDLRLLVMSATLAEGPIAELLGGAPIISSKGRTFPVETYYSSMRISGGIESQVGKTIIDALRKHEGDILAFLPGVPEIRRTIRYLSQQSLPPNTKVSELHGSLSLEQQGEAIAACSEHERKVVLATSIAESSLTVEGVKIVVDSGLMRISRFSPRTGMSHLETVAVSKASADQRRGRAGRQAPGVCYRLWTEVEHAHLLDQGRPEIVDADLSSLALELAVWGVRDPMELQWLTPPPPIAFNHANLLLKQLKALTTEGTPTIEGIRIAKLGIHPRLGAMLLAATDHGMLQHGCELASLLSDRDLLPSERNVDIQLRLDLLNVADRSNGAAQRIKAQAAQWEWMLHSFMKDGSATKENIGRKSTLSIGALLAIAYPDRIAQRRGDGRYLLANGRGALLPEVQPLSRYQYLVVCEMDDAGSEGKIRSAAAVGIDVLEGQLSSYLHEEEVVEWDDAAKAVRARYRLRLGALILKEGPVNGLDLEAVADVLVEAIGQKGIQMLPFNKQSKALLGRMKLMQLSGDKDWPDVSEETLLMTMKHWLKPHLYGLKSQADLQKLSMGQLLGNMLSWKQTQELDEHIPTHFVAPSGSRIPIDYSDPDNPVLAVRLQELFGLKETPSVARGKLPITLHLLSPSQRPVQVTRDLASFWEHAYFEVKKDLKGRYPKHYWPDNPLEATATSRAKPRT